MQVFGRYICLRILYLRELKLLYVVEGTHTALEAKINLETYIYCWKINQLRKSIS